MFVRAFLATVVLVKLQELLLHLLLCSLRFKARKRKGLSQELYGSASHMRHSWAH